MSRKIPSNQAAKVLGAPSNKNRFSFDTVICHDPVSAFLKWNAQATV